MSMCSLWILTYQCYWRTKHEEISCKHTPYLLLSKDKSVSKTDTVVMPNHKVESNASYCKIERISHTVKKDLAAINKEKLNSTFKKKAPVFSIQVIPEKILFCQQHQLHLRWLATIGLLEKRSMQNLMKTDTENQILTSATLAQSFYFLIVFSVSNSLTSK